jgi:hypothetical protein
LCFVSSLLKPFLKEVEAEVEVEVGAEVKVDQTTEILFGGLFSHVVLVESALLLKH